MFLETIIAVFLLGAIAGAWALDLLHAGPLRAENQALRLRQAERAWADEQEARNLARFRAHLGTPYRPETVAPMTEAAAVTLAHNHLIDAMADNTRWSRKAPPLKVVK